MFKTGKHYILLFYETSGQQPKSKDPNVEKLLQHVERTFRCFTSSETFGKLWVPTSKPIPWTYKNSAGFAKQQASGWVGASRWADATQQAISGKINSCMSSHIPCHPFHWNIPGNCLQLQMRKISDNGFLEVSNLNVQSPPNSRFIASPKLIFRITATCHSTIRLNRPPLESLEFSPGKHELLQWVGQRANPDQYLRRMHGYRSVIYVPYSNVFWCETWHHRKNTTTYCTTIRFDVYISGMLFLAKDPRSPT